MKKWIHSVIAVLLASICLLPSAAFAADNTDTVPEGGYIAADPTRGRCDFHPRGFADLGRC